LLGAPSLIRIRDTDEMGLLRIEIANEMTSKAGSDMEMGWCAMVVRVEMGLSRWRLGIGGGSSRND
jgi:hypothetical protein